MTSSRLVMLVGCIIMQTNNLFHALTDKFKVNLSNVSLYNLKIIKGFLTVTFFVFIGKFASGAKEIAIAWKYGANTHVDAYVFVFNLVMLPSGILFSIFTAVLVPLITTLRHKKNSQQLQLFFSELSGVLILLSISATLLTSTLLPLLYKGLFDLPNALLLEVNHMTFALSWVVFLGCYISFISVWVMAYGYHLNTLLEALPAAVILMMLLLPKSMMTSPLVVGTLAGFTLQLTCLLYSLRKTNIGLKLTFGFKSQAWRSFKKSMLVMGLGQAIFSLVTVIDQFFAAHFESGSIAILSYANRIISLAISLGLYAITRATMPEFSKAAIDKSIDSYHLAKQWIVIAFVGGCIACGVLFFSAGPIIHLLLKHGHFTLENSLETQRLMKWGVIQLPFYYASLVMTSYFSAHKQYYVLLILSILGVVTKFLLSSYLVNSVGLIGLQMSSVLTYFVNGVCLFGFYCYSRKHAGAWQL